VKKILAIPFVGIVVLAMVSISALAATRTDVTISKDNRTTIATKGQFRSSKANIERPAGLTKIFDNIGTKYPDGAYWCCTGATVFGPLNGLSAPELWEAVGFTPSASLNVTKIEIAVGWVQYKSSGEFTDVLISLNADDGTGKPGAALAKFKAQISGTPLGSCCAFVTKKSKGIPVTAGTPYWIVISTEKKSDVWAAVNLNDTLQLPTDAIPTGFWCSGTAAQCGTANNTWQVFNEAPGFAFAVFGK
jgi:hypothetical protein